MRQICGIDGAPGGWAVARASVQVSHPRLREVRVDFAPDLVGTMEEYRDGAIDAVAVDMPIGLLDHHPRDADVEARRMLGSRRSSVFPTPLRTTLAATDYEEACERSLRAAGVKLSKQAFNLLPKIRELDELVTTDDQAGWVEAHPECAFARLRGGPVIHPKRTPAGRSERRALLQLVIADADINRVLAQRVVPEIDLLDALANTVTASHLAAGTEIRLGQQRDQTGKRAEIVY